jgi:tetratricopeptide (TPR) repeat protein
MADVKFCFLGTPSLEVDGVVTTNFRWSKILAVFAYLVLHPGEHSREAIATALWPDRPIPNATHNLRQILVYANQLLTNRAGSALSVSRHTISLRPGSCASDVDHFLAMQSPTQDRFTTSACQRLVSDYTGPFLPQIDEAWIVNTRMQLARMYQESLVFLARELLQTDPNRSIALADAAIAEDPFDDPARAAKIAGLRELGRDAAARQEYTAYSEFLSTELGMQPGRVVIDALREDSSELADSRNSTEVIDPQTESISGAVQLLVGQGMHEAAANLAMALVPVWIGRGTPAHGRRVMEGVFENQRHPLGDAHRLAIAKLARAEGDTGRARILLAEVLATNPTPQIAAEALLTMARLDLTEVNSAGALRNALLSLRLLRSIGNRDLQFEAWTCVVIARFHSGQFERTLQPTVWAEKLIDDSPDSASRVEMQLFRALSLVRLARAAEAEQIANGIWSKWRGVTSPASYKFKSTLGRLFEDLHRREDAKLAYLEAISEGGTHGNIFSLNVVRTYLGDLEFELGNIEESLRLHQTALKSRRKLDQNLGIATSLRGIGRALLNKECAGEARTCLQESAQRYRDDNALSGYASSLLMLSQAEFEAGDPDLARRLANNAVEILRGMTLSTRLTIGPWGERILEQGENLLRRMELRSC